MKRTQLTADRNAASRESNAAPPKGLVVPPATERDPFEFLSKPHTISAMILGGAVLIVFAFNRNELADSVTNAKSGIIAMCGVFLLFSMLQMRDGIFYRPHPAFWRMIMGASVLYLMVLIFLLFQNIDDARQLMKYIDPKLGVPLPERSYADHCELYTPDDPVSSFRHLKDTLYDEFIWAHLLGWWGKTLLLRDAYMCWILSILFEIHEVTFQHMLPNFAECWWDHIILDILVCNGLGIILGMWTCRYLEMKTYDWTGFWKIPTVKGKALRLVTQFTPESWTSYQWAWLANWKRFSSVLVVISMVSVIELNAFFLKYLLWIPPPHPINIWRLLLWCGLGMPGLREYFQFVTDPTLKRFGPMAWLCIAVSSGEVLLCIKWGRGQFPDPMPAPIFWSWVVFLTVFFVWAVCFFTYRHFNEQKTKAPVITTKAVKSH